MCSFKQDSREKHREVGAGGSAFVAGPRIFLDKPGDSAPQELERLSPKLKCNLAFIFFVVC